MLRPNVGSLVRGVVGTFVGDWKMLFRRLLLKRVLWIDGWSWKIRWRHENEVVSV